MRKFNDTRVYGAHNLEMALHGRSRKVALITASTHTSGSSVPGNGRAVRRRWSILFFID